MRRFKQFDGQGLVEFALVLPILLFLVIGAVDIGRAFYIKVMLENSAREGAYYMINNPDEGKANSFALAKTATQIEAQDSGFTIPAQDIIVKCMEGATENNDCPSGSTVIVTVQYNFQLAINVFIKGPLKISNDARMLIP